MADNAGPSRYHNSESAPSSGSNIDVQLEERRVMTSVRIGAQQPDDAELHLNNNSITLESQIMGIQPPMKAPFTSDRVSLIADTPGSNRHQSSEDAAASGSNIEIQVQGQRVMTPAAGAGPQPLDEAQIYPNNNPNALEPQPMGICHPGKALFTNDRISLVTNTLGSSRHHNSEDTADNISIIETQLQERRVTSSVPEAAGIETRAPDGVQLHPSDDPNILELQPIGTYPPMVPLTSDHVPFRFTYYRLSWISLVIQFGILKAVSTYQGKNILSATFDLLLGVGIVVTLYIAGLVEEVRPRVWSWYFHDRVPPLHGILNVMTYLVFTTYMYFIPCTLATTLLSGLPNIGFLWALRRSRRVQRLFAHFDINDTFLITSWSLMALIMAYLSYDLQKVICKGKR
ncbi:hypothetical protein FRC15_008976 [Serendipita sp. 397]|nr:hypothetical protein FRC15_008976 [Serendipita sp. 397]